MYQLPVGHAAPAVIGIFSSPSQENHMRWRLDRQEDIGLLDGY